MRFDTLALPLFLVAQVLSSPAPRSLNLPHEYRPLPPPKWTPLRRAAPSFKLPLRIGLAQSNLDQLESFLLDVSHPDSPNYSKHWSPAQVSEIFRPSNTSIEIVHQWLTEQGIHHSRVRLSTSGGWIAAEVTVQEAEHLLDTKYYEYEHADSGSKHIACEKAYHLPGHISKHVDLITPTLHFDVQIRRALNQSTVASWSRHPTTDGINIGDPGASVVSPKTSGGRMVCTLCLHGDSFNEPASF